ncbi:MAG: type II toxin-antitoxin system VapB family antitoxin [Deltaproteobacteria bacterium]|nr:type II toxin-antitoxin system VapB family antitoxin [Deltaproteobacteria bacterium]
MRTTITISENLLNEAQKISGLTGYSEAIVTSLQDYVNLKNRLQYLSYLFEKKAPHSQSSIKKLRKKKTWSL